MHHSYALVYYFSIYEKNSSPPDITRYFIKFTPISPSIISVSCSSNFANDTDFVVLAALANRISSMSAGNNFTCATVVLSSAHNIACHKEQNKSRVLKFLNILCPYIWESQNKTLKPKAMSNWRIRGGVINIVEIIK